MDSVLLTSIQENSFCYLTIILRTGFENNVDKGQNADNQHFLFPTIFSSTFTVLAQLSSKTLDLDRSKYLLFVRAKQDDVEY